MDVAEELSIFHNNGHSLKSENVIVGEDFSSENTSSSALAAGKTSSQLRSRVTAPPHLSTNNLSSMTIKEMKQAVNSVDRLINQFQDEHTTTPSSMGEENGEDMKEDEGNEYLLVYKPASSESEDPK